MTRNALIQGASRGLGLEITRQLLARGDRVFATCREPGTAQDLRRLAASHSALRILTLDVSDEDSIAAAAQEIRGHTDRLHLVMNVAGVLHGDGFGPERKLEEITPEALEVVFRVNAYGPILVAKHVLPLLRHDEPSVFASLSARVGSIEDNGRGGWYSYRASKAAQNQFTKTLSIELGRRAKHCAVIALHPGTVQTDLSAPFQKYVPDSQLFPVDRAARQLLHIVDGVSALDTGRFYAWDGSDIPW
jgi:NAD(P)-dependent dehydrogenase (short-subunit alcohol dehydrogenase family)